MPDVTRQAGVENQPSRGEVPMHADHELQTGQRMPEETTMDMTRRYPVRHRELGRGVGAQPCRAAHGCRWVAYPAAGTA